jgi:hypothetical protein
MAYIKEASLGATPIPVIPFIKDLLRDTPHQISL